MLDQFCYKVYMPSSGKYEYYKELTNKELLVILKYCTNQDREGLASYLEHVLKIKSVNEHDLHRIDKFCVLYTMMLVCIKGNVTLMCTCNETEQTYNIDISIVDVLNKISNLEYHGDDVLIKSGANEYTLQYPRELYNDKQQLHVTDVLQSVKIDETTYDLTDYTKQQKTKVIENLPGGDVSKILKHITTYATAHDDVVYITYQSPYATEPEPINYTVSLLNNQLFESYLVMVNTTLKAFYEMSHSMATNFELSHQHYLNMTPAETMIYYDLMKTDIEAQKAAQASEQNTIDKTIQPV